jgi:hypothetical protein
LQGYREQIYDGLPPAQDGGVNEVYVMRFEITKDKGKRGRIFARRSSSTTWESWRSKSMHQFLLPLTPRLCSSSAKAEGKPRTDEQHRVFIGIGIGAFFFGLLSPGGNARDNDGDFANRQEVGLSPPYFDKRTPGEKKKAAEEAAERSKRQSRRQQAQLLSSRGRSSRHAGIERQKAAGNGFLGPSGRGHRFLVRVAFSSDTDTKKASCLATSSF